MRATELGVGQGMGHPRILLRLLHQPAAVAHPGEDREEGLVIDDSVAGRGEKAFQHGGRKTHVAALAGGERITADILAMDVNDALSMALGDRDRVATGKGHMPRIQEQPDRGSGILHQPVHVLGALDDRAHVVMDGHAHAFRQHMIGYLGEALTQGLPFGHGAELGPAGGGCADVQDDLAGGLGKHHHRRGETGQQLQVIGHGRDLGLGIAGHELGAVPAGDKGQAMLFQQRPELARRAGEFPAQLHPGKSGLADFGQALLQRKI